MIVKNTDQRVVVLVDVQNLYYSAKNLFDAKVNFKNLLIDVVGDRKLIRALAYVIKAEVGKEAAFFEALYEAGFDIREKELQIFVGGAKKGDWDVGIAMDAIRFSEKVDSVILVSGDGDFIPLVEYLKTAKGCLVELAAFGKTSSRDLKDKVDDFLDLETNKKRYLIPNKLPKKQTPIDRLNILKRVASRETKPEVSKDNKKKTYTKKSYGRKEREEEKSGKSKRVLTKSSTDQRENK